MAFDFTPLQQIFLFLIQQYVSLGKGQNYITVLNSALLVYGMTLSPYAARLPSAISPLQGRKKYHYPPTPSLSHLLGEWNTRQSIDTHTHTRK